MACTHHWFGPGLGNTRYNLHWLREEMVKGDGVDGLACPANIITQHTSAVAPPRTANTGQVGL